MADLDTHTFARTYKYKTKTEQNGFIVKYVLFGDVKPIHEAQKKNVPKQEVEVIVSKQQARLDAQFQVKNERKHHENHKKIEIEQKQFEELRKYTKINMKNYKVKKQMTEEEQQEIELNTKKQKKKRYRKAEKQQDSAQEQVQIEKSQSRKKEKRDSYKEQKEEVLFKEYLSRQQIEESRRKGEKIYYKGRLQYGQGPKYRGKIISQEVDGLLIVQGKHCNRAIHDEKVYFSIIHEQNQKSLCNVHYVFRQKRLIVGRVEYLYSKKIYILKPTNSRIVAMNARNQQLPKGLKNKLDTHYFTAEYLGWDAKKEYPECKIIEQFGKFGQIDVETTSLLKTCGIEDKEHDTEAVKTCLKKFLDNINKETGQYEVSQKQVSKREDLRKERIITIDPLNARDFDDALSITETENGYQIGVHIADASYFVEEGSQIDEEAKKRTTSVYLTHRVIPMLPRILCENLCSLNPGCNRLTFTLRLKLDKKGNILQSPRVCRSIIHSKARFTYEQAQKIILGEITSQNQIQQGFGCINPLDFSVISEDVKLMHKLSTQLRKRRVERGSLFFQIPKKVFKLDENSRPIGFEIYERKQAHFLVEELMILANEQIGTILVKQLGQNAFLRRHKYPGSKKIQRFEDFMTKINLPFKMSFQARVQDQINQVISKKELKQSIRDIVKYEMINLLEAADYFTVGKSQPKTWIHYALNSPVYTHFTSPIRRYPDILVHRLLASIIDKSHNSKIEASLIELCNEKKLQSKRVSNGCEKIFLCLYLRQNAVISKGIINQAEQWGIKVCVPKYDFKGVLRFKEIKDLSILSIDNDDKGRKMLKLEYTSKDVTTKFILKQYQQIQIKLSCKEGFPLQYQLTIVMPHPKQPGQHLLIA